MSQKKDNNWNNSNLAMKTKSQVSEMTFSWTVFQPHQE